ncbi:MAG: hypothetical protein OXI25_05740 [Chloroflexota bacterium]|nr:hypothetical protein [Chloroflexota bacterium]
MSTPDGASPDSPRFGEVVEAAIDRVVVQAHRLYGAPPMGALVRLGGAGQGAVYGVVAGVATTALDPTRRVIARGADAATEEEIYREHPQIERLLRTDAALLTVGFDDGGALRHYLPPLPPRIHAFAYLCAPDEVRRFAASLDFIGLLAARRDPASDDVLAATLRHAAACFDDPRAFLTRAGRAAAAHASGDAARVAAIVRRIPTEALD